MSVELYLSLYPQPTLMEEKSFVCPIMTGRKTAQSCDIVDVTFLAIIRRTFFFLSLAPNAHLNRASGIRILMENTVPDLGEKKAGKNPGLFVKTELEEQKIFI